MKDFPGNSRIGAIAFVIENKAYVGLGRSIEDKKQFYKDFGVYDAVKNSWDSLLLEFPGYAQDSSLRNNIHQGQRRICHI